MSAAPVREESVQTSLQDLMRLEEERIARERDESARRAADEAQEKEEARLREERAREASERALAEAAQARERAAREEEARLLGMQRAIVEKARVEAEARARAESEAALRAREEARGVGAEVASAASATPERYVGVAIVSGLAGIVATLLMAGGVYAFAVAPAAETREQLLRDQIEVVRREAADERGKRERAESTSTELEARIRKLEEDARVAKKSEGPAPTPSAGPRGRGPTGPVAPPPKKDLKNPCAPGDPLCSDLSHP